MRKIVFLWSILSIIFISCDNSKSKPSNLSFVGITIGEEFPDSLKDIFEFKDYDIPRYEGLVHFDLPNYPNTSLWVAAATDLEGKEVTCIHISNMDIDQAGDFFEMLKSKYGLPVSDYGNPDVNLKKFLNNLYSDLGYSYYNDKIDVSGNRVLVKWSSVKANSDIVMIGNTYHFPQRYQVSEPETSIYFQYIDKKKFDSIEEQAENNKLNRKREEYKKNNAKTMKQDF